ncbi:UDP-glucose 4-epimerase GalE [Candidatus Woesebacteria bacterium]|nr:MAG: UDP-glucose 4-epimerase GalE [Candidatus Woesebacteria bacterium]
MDKSKILITGAGGYIGSVATYLVLQKGYKVVALDNFSRGYEEPLKLLQDMFGKESLSIYKRDLHDDLTDIFENNKIKSVLHYAAYCLVSESMEKPEMYFTNNVCGTQNLLTTMLANNVTNIVFSSTCTVYAPAQYIPIDDKHPTGPESPYGESKLITEKIIEWHGKTRGLKYVILRYFNVCGASDDGLIGDSKKPSVLLIQNAVRGALGIEEFLLTCPQVDTPDSTPIRDYVNVVDLNEAHLKAIEYLEKDGKNEIINLGTGEGNSVLEIVKVVQELTGKKFDLKAGEKRKGEATKMIADIKKAEKILNWKPQRNVSDSIKSLIAWYGKQPTGWRS